MCFEEAAPPAHKSKKRELGDEGSLRCLGELALSLCVLCQRVADSERRWGWHRQRLNTGLVSGVSSPDTLLLHN